MEAPKWNQSTKQDELTIKDGQGNVVLKCFPWLMPPSGSKRSFIAVNVCRKPFVARQEEAEVRELPNLHFFIACFSYKNTLLIGRLNLFILSWMRFESRERLAYREDISTLSRMIIIISYSHPFYSRQTVMRGKLVRGNEVYIFIVIPRENYWSKRMLYSISWNLKW